MDKERLHYYLWNVGLTFWTACVWCIDGNAIFISPSSFGEEGKFFRSQVAHLAGRIV